MAAAEIIELHHDAQARRAERDRRPHRRADGRGERPRGAADPLGPPARARRPPGGDPRRRRPDADDPPRLDSSASRSCPGCCSRSAASASLERSPVSASSTCCSMPERVGACTRRGRRMHRPSGRRMRRPPPLLRYCARMADLGTVITAIVTPFDERAARRRGRVRLADAPPRGERLRRLRRRRHDRRGLDADRRGAARARRAGACANAPTASRSSPAPAPTTPATRST